MQRILPMSVNKPVTRPLSSLPPSPAVRPSRFSRSFWAALLAAAPLHGVAHAAPHSQIASQTVVSRVQWHAPAAKASSPTRLADIVPTAVDTNKPPAAPVENPPALTVPVTPEKNEPPTPAPAPPENATPTPPTTVEPSPVTPSTMPVENGLAPEDAEGREIAAVRIVGNRVVSEDTILLSIAATKPGAAFSQRQADLDKGRIRDLGYFAVVDYQVVPNLQDPKKVDVIFVVTENRVVTGFRFEGAKELKSADLQKVLVSKTGAVLSSKNVDEDVKKIQEAYRQQGFAALVSDVHQDADGTVVYVLQEGIVSRIEFEGLKKTKPSIVRSQILTKSGEPFNEQKLQRDLNRIYDTGFFEDVSYKIADDPQKPGALIVTIVLKEKRTGQVSFGVGFDSRSKISGFAGISESNFQGTGKNVSAQVELGAERSFNLGYGDRFVGKNNASYGISLYDQTTFREPRSVERLIGGGSTGNNTTFDYEERRQGTRLNYTHPLDFEHTKNILLGYRLEKVRLFLRDSDNNTTPIDLPEDSSGRVGAISLGFLRDKRDLKLDPSRGGPEILTLENGASFIGGTTKITKPHHDKPP
jgi:outer membrane protein insertion porin family